MTLHGARRPDRRPARWSRAGFAREVDLVRLHLVPIRTRGGLAASFAREAFHADLVTPNDDSIGPVGAAYAIRWLELGDGAARPPWTIWLDQAREAQPGSAAGPAARRSRDRTRL